MNKEMFEMLDKLNKNIEQGFTEINKRLDDTNERLNDTNKRLDDTNSQMVLYFDEINTRFDKIDERIVGIGAHFEELSKNTIEVQDVLTKDTKYLKHKVGQLEQEVFFLNSEQ